MSHNSFGHLFRVTTWARATDPPSAASSTAARPVSRLPKRTSSLSSISAAPASRVSPRSAKRPIRCASYRACSQCQRSAGYDRTPIALQIENTDQRSKDYGDIAQKFRPGHADFAYEAKYGIRDYRGGGRSSARETAMRVAAGAVARRILPSISIRGALVQMGPHKIDRANWDWAEVDRNPFFSPDPTSVDAWTAYLDGVRKSGSSCGAVVELVAEGIPAGWGRRSMASSTRILPRR